MSLQIIYGKQPVLELLKAGKRKIISIHYVGDVEKTIGEIISRARKKGIRITKTDKRTLSNRTENQNHQGILAEVHPPDIYDLKTFIKKICSESVKPIVVVMDSISDPHNFGAILRSAESFGINGVIFPKDRSADINSTVVKTSAGASEYMNFCKVTNIARTVTELRKEGFHAISAEADGEIELSKFNPLFPLAIVLGAEGKGVRPLVRKNCNETIRISLKGKLGSLNVSNAAAVIFYEVTGK